MLITLAIIGIVAALTIPSVVSNYQKNQYVTQLKKTYNVLQNGFRQYMASQGVTKLTDTKLWSAMNGVNTQTDYKDQKAFQAELNNVFKITKHYDRFQTEKKDPDFFKRYYLNRSDYYSMSTYYASFFLTDGSIVFYYCSKEESLSSYPDKIKELNGKMKSGLCSIYIDVNGAKKPNKFGRDVFHFDLDNQGTLFPWGGKDASIFHYGNIKDTWNCSTASYNCRVDKLSNGWGCSARIMDEGWKMTY